MSDTPDFEFEFGVGRYLRGRGWRGLAALGLLLIALVALAWIAHLHRDVLVGL
jgi:hypothetical protein